MEEYLRFNYSKCNRQFGFLDSVLFVQLSSHSVLLITLPCHIFGFYCILRKTPDRMMPIKMYLVNLQFWSFIVDFLYTTLITPIFFFPALASCSMGLLSIFPIKPIRIFQLGLFGYGGLATASVMIFDYRDVSLSQKDKTNCRKTVRYLWHASNFLICLVVCWTLEASVEDVDIGRLDYLVLNPCPIPEYFTECNFVLSRNSKLFTCSTLFYLVYIIVQTVSLATHSTYNLYTIRASLVSNATRRLQKALFVGTCIQVLVPLFVLIVPIAFCYYAIFYTYYNQGLLNLTGILISFHGVVATTMMILVNTPYRRFAKQLLTGQPSNKGTPIAMPFVSRSRFTRMNDL